jgi:hypothetical protein
LEAGLTPAIDLLSAAAALLQLAASTCACTSGTNQSTSVMSGDAICSVAEDEGTCSVRALGVSPDLEPDQAERLIRYRDVLDRMAAEVGISLEPTHALQTAMNKPPEAWDDRDFEQVVTLLVAQAGISADRLTEIYRFLDRNDYRLRPAFADAAFRDRSEGFDLQDYKVTVSYGCIELTQNTFTVRAKLPASRAGRTCSDL